MGFFDDLFNKGMGDQSEYFDRYGDEMRGIGRRFDPYINRGQEAGQRAFDQYGRLVDDPNSVQDQIAGGFYMSPYQQFMLDETTNRMNQNAANTGFLGSGPAQKALSDRIGTMTGQFMNDYINRGLGLYDRGLGGFERADQMGLGALGEQAGYDQEAAGANLQAGRSRAAAKSNLIGGLAGLAGSFASGFAGGIPGLGAGVGNFLSPGGSTYNIGAR